MLRVAATLLVWLAVAAPASASSLIARGATHVQLSVSADGRRALVSYTVRGRRWFVLASGAVNARAPSRTRPQVRFRTSDLMKRPAFHSGCTPLDVPLYHAVAGCAGPTNWALQTWKRNLRNFGVRTAPFLALPELRLSHWSGPLADLEMRADWSYSGRWDHIYGFLRYRGKPVYGFGTTRFGAPTDAYGRLIFLDTLDSTYGHGWHRENSFVAHNPTGVFCYDLSPHRAGLTGKGAAYRATVEGPGVTPDVSVIVSAPGPYDPVKDTAANIDQFRVFFGDRLCHPS